MNLIREVATWRQLQKIAQGSELNRRPLFHGSKSARSCHSCFGGGVEGFFPD
jgi:hypothetical protein